jgi:hypothetical protein
MGHQHVDPIFSEILDAIAMNVPCRVSADLAAYQTAQNNACDERDYVFEAGENIEDPKRLEYHVEYMAIAVGLAEIFSNLSQAGQEQKDADNPATQAILRAAAHLQRYCFTQELERLRK